MANEKTGQERKRKDRRATIFVILLAVLILAAIVAAVLLLTHETKDAPTDPVPELERTNADAFAFEIPGFTLIEDAEIGDVKEQLRVLGVGRYTGTYMEDLSDDEVIDVLAIVVQNTSDDWITNADLTLDCGDGTALFTVSALPGTGCALLLEQNRLAYTKSMTLRDPACTFCVDDMSDYVIDFGQEFAVQPYEGDVLVVQNISGQEISSDALLFYKNVASYGKRGEMLYLGGILYSTRFAGPIAAGEQRQAAPEHYTISGSAILFMQYGE